MGVIRDGKLVNLQVNSLTFLSVVEMYPDEGSTHTLTFSPRGNSSTGANVLIRVGINVEGSAHGYNVFIEQRADGGEFIRENMIGDVRTLMGSDYDLSKTDGSQRVKLYAMTKGGMHMLLREAAIEFAKYGVRVNMIMPAGVKIEFKTGNPRPFQKPRLTPPREYYEKYPMYPLGRHGLPEDSGWACVYLASQEAEHISGACLRADGCSMLL